MHFLCHLSQYIQMFLYNQFSLSDKQKFDSQSLDLSDDEELREQMDMHSIIVSTINEEPLFTAEQVH